MPSSGPTPSSAGTCGGPFARERSAPTSPRRVPTGRPDRRYRLCEMTTPNDEIFVDNGARKLSLDELGRTQAGMGRLMPEVGARVWKLWYAAQAANWPLAK